ncbi:MAG TPA: DUF3539 domain-containing protein [Cyanobacteria bacterium UBA8156]|jgi:PII interaction protein X|nr:DUF3539 domain-containing protein [Cyanobacteria bacterium UBA8156]
MAETYLNHPNFGLLTRICEIEDGRSLFTTLYAYRLFFTIDQSNGGVRFESVTRNTAKVLVENRLRMLRRGGDGHECDRLQMVYKRTFA